MKRWTRHLLAIVLAAVLAAGCSKAPSRTDVPTTTDESGSTLIGNPAASLKAQNLAVAVKIVEKPPAAPAPAAEPVVAGQLTVTWDPPPAEVDHYRLERKIGPSGTPTTLADNIPPDQRQQIDYGELGATHYYRVWAFDTAKRSDVTEWVSARIPTFCDYPSGWSMVWPFHGCAQFESTFALDEQITYFAGSSRIVVHSDFGLLMPPYATIDVGPDAVLHDVCAIDRNHVFAVGHIQAPRERARGAAFAIVDGAVTRHTLAGLERGPLRRVFCDTAERSYAGGDDGVFIQCSPNGCAPVAGVDNRDLEKPYAAIWGVPGQIAITGTTTDSLMIVRPGARPEPLAFGLAGGADDQGRGHAIVDLLGHGDWAQHAPLPTVAPSLLIATEEGLFAGVRGGALRRIDDGRWRRLWGSSDDFYAVGDGIAHFRTTPEHRITKGAEGPPLEFTSIHGTAPDRFFLTDSTGRIYQGDGNGHYTSLLNIALDMLPGSRAVVNRTSSGQRITDIAAAGTRLAVSWLGAAEGLVLFSPADGSMRPVRELRDADVYALAPAGDRLLVASSIGLFAMDAQGGETVSKLADGCFRSAWDCGARGICAVRRPMIFGPADVIVLVRPGEEPAVQTLAPARGFSKFKQAAGSPAGGLFAIEHIVLRNGGRDVLLSSDGRGWTEETLPAPPEGTSDVALRIVSAPGERPLLLATYAAGREASYALIADRDGAWSAIEWGGHLRTLFRILPSGERIDVNLDGSFSPTSFAALNPDDLWAVADGQFLFRWTR